MGIAVGSGVAVGTKALAKVAGTPAAGTALVNGALTLATWTAPNDGQIHAVLIAATKVVTTQEVGGGVTVNFTTGGQGGTWGLFGTGAAAGIYSCNGNGGSTFAVDPGSTITLTQTAPLTGGATKVFAELLGV